MDTSKLDTFTDRRRETALFNALRGRDPQQPWPLLPILTFIAPGGSGKTTLMQYLRVKHCCLDNGQAAIPHAYLDFTRTDAPDDLLSILINIRDQLCQQRDAYGKTLTFPRFDLGAAIAAATMSTDILPSLNRKEVASQLSMGLPLLGAMGEMGNAFGNILPLIPPLLVGLKWAGALPPVRDVVSRLEHGPGWRWYHTNSNDTGLRAAQSISDVLLRLYNLCRPGTSERADVLEHLLPAAFVADLYDTFDSTHETGAWSKVANVVVFFDGFEALLKSATQTGMRLLEVLACSSQRKSGRTDPLLVVLGTRTRLFDVTSERHNPSFDVLTNVSDQQTLMQEIHTSIEQWRRQLPKSLRFLRVDDLYFPLWLQDFGLEDTRTYIAAFKKSVQTQAFTNDELINAVHRVTHGHPLFVALAVAAVIEAEAHGRTIELHTFDEEKVSSEVVDGH